MHSTFFKYKPQPQEELQSKILGSAKVEFPYLGFSYLPPHPVQPISPGPELHSLTAGHLKFDPRLPWPNIRPISVVFCTVTSSVYTVTPHPQPATHVN